MSDCKASNVECFRAVIFNVAAAVISAPRLAEDGTRFKSHFKACEDVWRPCFEAPGF